MSLRQMRPTAGLTLVELVLVIVMVGVLASIALRSVSRVSDTARVEQTKQELDRLAAAIVGNPELHNNGVRADFGYVGDVGALPPSLDALHVNPGGYATWKGPYIENRFVQTVEDYRRDAWGNEYEYSVGVTVSSTGGFSGGSRIVRKLANSTADLLHNQITGVVLDLDGTPPGSVYQDSLIVCLTVPDGAGGTIAKASRVDAGGYFDFDSIPIGNHDVTIIYEPAADSINGFVSVLPQSAPHSVYRLSSDFWQPASAGSLEMVSDSDTLKTINCFKLVFWVTNTADTVVTVNSLTMTWASPTAYYENVTWGGTVLRSGNPALASGDMVGFSLVQTLNPGESVQVRVEAFHQDVSGGGPPVDMTGTNFNVEFSDGSRFGFTADLCN